MSPLEMGRATSEQIEKLDRVDHNSHIFHHKLSGEKLAQVEAVITAFRNDPDTVLTFKSEQWLEVHNLSVNLSKRCRSYLKANNEPSMPIGTVLDTTNDILFVFLRKPKA